MLHKWKLGLGCAAPSTRIYSNFPFNIVIVLKLLIVFANAVNLPPVYLQPLSADSEASQGFVSGR